MTVRPQLVGKWAHSLPPGATWEDWSRPGEQTRLDLLEWLEGKEVAGSIYAIEVRPDGTGIAWAYTVDEHGTAHLGPDGEVARLAPQEL